MIHAPAGSTVRLTFTALNRVRAKAVTYPQQYGDDVVPFVSQLKYDPMFDGAVKQVFSHTLLCNGIDVATKAAAEERRTNPTALRAELQRERRQRLLHVVEQRVGHGGLHQATDQRP